MIQQLAKRFPQISTPRCFVEITLVAPYIEALAEGHP